MAAFDRLACVDMALCESMALLQSPIYISLKRPVCMSSVSFIGGCQNSILNV